jgi:hypothetical protein
MQYFLEIIGRSDAKYVRDAALALMHLVVANVTLSPSSERHALQYMASAIPLLRKELGAGREPDDASFVAVVCLACFAVC